MSFDFDCLSYRQLLAYATDDSCTIEFNGSQYQVKTAAALAFSAKIFSIYQTDPTTKRFVIEGSLKNNDNMKLIDQFFTTGKIQTDFTSETIYDLLQFALSFEFKDIRLYIQSYFRTVEINFENYSELVKSFQIDEEISLILRDFMIEHFHEKSADELSLAFSGMESRLLTLIFTSPKLKVKHENQVAQLFITLAQQNPNYAENFELINIEWVSTSLIKELLKIYETTKLNKPESYFYRQLKLLSEKQPKYYGIKYPRTFANIIEEIKTIQQYHIYAEYKNIHVIWIESIKNVMETSDDNARSGSNYCFDCFRIIRPSNQTEYPTYKIRYVSLAN